MKFYTYTQKLLMATLAIFLGVGATIRVQTKPIFRLLSGLTNSKKLLAGMGLTTVLGACYLYPRKKEVTVEPAWSYYAANKEKIVNAEQAWTLDWDGIVTSHGYSYLGFVHALVPNWQAANILRLDVVNFISDLMKGGKETLKYDDGVVVRGAASIVGVVINKNANRKRLLAIPNYQKNLEAELHKTKPIQSVIDLVQAHPDMPLVIWTNNDYKSIKVKLDNVNKQIKQPLQPVGLFVAGRNPGIDQNSFSMHGKPAEEYYLKAYAYTQSLFTDGIKRYCIFIDDKAENVLAVRKLTEKNPELKIVAIHRDKKAHPNVLAKEIAFVRGNVQAEALGVGA